MEAGYACAKALAGVRSERLEEYASGSGGLLRVMICWQKMGISGVSPADL